MSEKIETVHLHRSNIKKNSYVFLLLIPSIAFVGVMAVFSFWGDEVKNLKSSTEVSANPKNDYTETRSALKIGESEIMVEVADNNSKRERGLSGRESLGDNEGMLFLFSKEDTHQAFWMKDMLIPIDIIWINDGRIVQIDKNAMPEPGVKDIFLKLYVPSETVDQVLEVKSGFSDEHNLAIGDSVSW